MGFLPTPAAIDRTVRDNPLKEQDCSHKNLTDNRNQHTKTNHLDQNNTERERGRERREKAHTLDNFSLRGERQVNKIFFFCFFKFSNILVLLA